MATAARPKPGSVEERNAPDLLAADGKRIRGRVPYGIESRDMGGWREVIEPGAFRSTVFDDLVATVDHVGVPLGRHPTTLELEDRADGLHWAVDPPAARADIREAVERGDLRAGSWRMVVGKDEWRGDVRHVQEVAVLRDVSIVTRPAYQAAEVEYRSQPDPNPAEAEEDTTMATEADKQTTEQPDEVRTEERRPPAGSLRVEERAELPVFQTLTDAFRSRGFPDGAASVTWDEFRTLTWGGGTVLTDLAPVRHEGVALGYDSRWVYPAFPSTGVDSSTTAVQILRQSSRTLPAGTAVVRPIDSVAAKPEVATATELVSQQLSQVAAIETNVPNILGEQIVFQSMVEVDLRLSISEGYDRLVLNGINTAGTMAAGTLDILTNTRKAMTGLMTAGYAPDTLVIDPPGAEQLDLLRSSGSEAFYLWSPGRFAPGQIFGLNVRVGKNAGTAVVDASAFGRLYSSPLQLQAFEADAGTTNRRNVRLEGNATFAVERVTAATRIT